MHALAQGKGGKCLSTTYVNASTKLEWECQKGHRWFAVPFSVKQGSWCPKCAGVEKKTLEDMHALAHANTGRCLSTVYVNSQTKLEWECQKGYQWFAVPNSVKQGSWCPHCAGNQLKTLKDMQILASANGGRCLSDTYINSRTKLLWKCRSGHRWWAAPDIMQQGHWCEICRRR